MMVLCSEDYIVEPASLKFLVEHGFDFIKQYSKGLSYYRGNDKVV
jgi:target of EGR1 protein 1